MNREDLQELSRLRLREARTLLNARHFDGAYYLAGYAVECALKARIAKRTRRHDFPEKKLAADSWTHDLTRLVGLADLRPALEAELSDPGFAIRWAVVKDWKQSSRYARVAEKLATDMYSAITARRGVMQWLRRHW